MAVVNRHRGRGWEGAVFRGNMGNEILEGDCDFITHYDDPMEDDSALTINILELLKQVEFFDTKESCDSEECGE